MGLCEFVPISFKGNYHCLLNIQVESAMLDFKFRSNKDTSTVASWLFNKEGKIPVNLLLSDASSVYNKYSTIVNKMYATL